MDHYLSSLRDELPERLHHLLEWDFLPWSYVRNRYSDHPIDPLVALFDAWVQIHAILDLETIASIKIPSESGGCLRCGSCCAYLRPGAVSERTYRRWLKAGVPAASFYAPAGKTGPAPSYNCWYYRSTRLRLCPFLLVNRVDSMPFCSIHHLGRDFRPPACSRYAPDPPMCQTGNFVPVF